ncbi:MAG: hypothetical protein KatS3mg131_2219 [Candidatus Tectimicrobiota bacterium]|nr:MAG: hypothetical protein KatS3mg131_2219 [Candidatus Tectomicrobia bacterium]
MKARVALVALLFLVGGCAVQSAPPSVPPHRFDKTEVDLEYGRPEPAVRYRPPRGAHLYDYDKTEVDLATPRR